MVEGQRPAAQTASVATPSLNPCCNGRGSKTARHAAHDERVIPVLILVVMEEGQRLY